MSGLMKIVSVMVVAVLLCCGCSRGQDPITSGKDDIPGSSINQNQDRKILASYRLTIDTASGAFEYSPKRESTGHWDVSDWLMPPKCYDCVNIEVLHIRPALKRILVRITLKNPTGLTAHDVRAIMITDAPGFDLLNADGWTDLWDGTGGILINPYLAFSPEAFPYFDYKMDPGEDAWRVCHIEYPDFPSLLEVDMLVDASWPTPAKGPVFFLDDSAPASLLPPEGGLILTSFTGVQHSFSSNHIISGTLDATPLGSEILEMAVFGSYSEYPSFKSTIETSQHNDPGIYKLLASISTTNVSTTAYYYKEVFVGNPFGELELISSFYLGPANQITPMIVKNGYVYTGSPYITAIDVSDPYNPQITDQNDTYQAMSFFANDSYLFCLTNGPFIITYDISNPGQMEFVNNIFTGYTDAFTGFGDYMYASGSYGVFSIDMTDVNNPQYNLLTDVEYFDNVACNNQYFAASLIGSNYAGVWDIADPSEPVRIDDVEILSIIPFLGIYSSYLFTGTILGPSEIHDLSLPGTVKAVGTLDKDYTNFISFDESSEKCAAYGFETGLQAIDISDTVEPRIIGFTPGWFYGACIDGEYIYAIRNQDVGDYTDFQVYKMP